MNLFIGCSTSNTIDKKYLEYGVQVGEYLSNKKYNLIFGGCNNGLLGTIYQQFKKNSCHITAVVSETFKKDLNNIDCNINYTTTNSIERYKKISQLSDVLIYLPGGIGTLTELFISIDLKRNKEINKPLLILNYDNFYDDVLTIIDKSINQNFSNHNDNKTYIVINDIKQLDTYLSTIKLD